MSSEQDNNPVPPTSPKKAPMDQIHNQAKDLMVSTQKNQAIYNLLYLLSEYNQQLNSPKSPDKKNRSPIFNFPIQGNMALQQQLPSELFRQSTPENVANHVSPLLFRSQIPSPSKRGRKPRQAKIDSKFPKDRIPKSPKKKFKTSSYIPKFIRSSSSPNNNGPSSPIFQTRTISTPEWESIHNNADNTENTTPLTLDNEHLGANVEMHKRLEVYETRIVFGLTKFHHPAYSVQLDTEEEQKPVQFTENEQLRLPNYEFKEIRNKIPLFWQPYPWDKPEHRMTIEESAALQKRIEDSYIRNTSFRFAGRSPKYKSMRKSSMSLTPLSSTSSAQTTAPQSPYKTEKARKKRTDSDSYKKRHSIFFGDIVPPLRASEVLLSNLYYETDESCDETDGELF